METKSQLRKKLNRGISIMNKFLLLLLCTFLLIGTASALTSISSCEELQNISNNLTENYQLINNIDCSDTSTWNGGAGFISIGNETNTFLGTFEGNGKTISNLYINNSTKNYTGLFGFVGNTSTISNVGVTNANITGGYRVGILAGRVLGNVNNSYSSGVINGFNGVGGLVGSSSGLVSYSNSSANVVSTSALTEDYGSGGLVGMTNGSILYSRATGNVNAYRSSGGLVGLFTIGIINNCSSTGNVNGSRAIGGLAGVNIGIINNSHSTGVVTATISGSNAIGGLVGYNNLTILNSYATGYVVGFFTGGGLVGVNDYGQINTSFATGNVTGTSYVGGLVGLSQNPLGKTYNSYALGKLNGTTYVGGLVGLIYGNIYNSYSVGNVTGTTSVGGLVGLRLAGGENNSFWDNETSGMANSSVGTAKSTFEMQNISTFTAWDFENVWAILPADYPILQWQIIEVPEEPEEPETSGRLIYNLMNSFGAGLGLFMTFLARSIPALLIVLAMVMIVLFTANELKSLLKGHFRVR
jgi:hypothetical protein